MQNSNWNADLFIQMLVHFHLILISQLFFCKTLILQTDLSLIVWIKRGLTVYTTNVVVDSSTQRYPIKFCHHFVPLSPGDLDPVRSHLTGHLTCFICHLSYPFFEYIIIIDTETNFSFSVALQVRKFAVTRQRKKHWTRVVMLFLSSTN